MKKFIIRLAATSIAIAIVAWILPQVGFTGGFLQLVLLALLFGLVNTFVKPVVSLLSLPVNLLTLGLFGIVINVVLLMGVAWIADTVFQAGLTIGGWPTADLSISVVVDAFITSVVFSIVQTVVGLVVRD